MPQSLAQAYAVFSDPNASVFAKNIAKKKIEASGNSAQTLTAQQWKKVAKGGAPPKAAYLKKHAQPKLPAPDVVSTGDLNPNAVAIATKKGLDLGPLGNVLGQVGQVSDILAQPASNFAPGGASYGNDAKPFESPFGDSSSTDAGDAPEAGSSKTTLLLLAAGAVALFFFLR